jgi:hypothetical protein
MLSPGWELGKFPELLEQLEAAGPFLTSAPEFYKIHPKQGFRNRDLIYQPLTAT